ncbi:serine hydrolase [Pedobacter foliorum]|uniref:serine hydrolase domain-containing protein n=1 Tax=Pedobacter foliorum TaxID=2739058 RepID=UPI001564CE8B|nr:serine hydrolase domain-containing protein [Pedobacter foliorum]NRF41781.1 beta-lactamase family protein [Pedobacter foliorum]
MKKTIAFLSLLFFIAFSSCAQTASPPLNKAKLDSLLNALDKNNKAMMSLAVMLDGKLVYSKAIGDANRSSAKPITATPQTKYRIGSITKMFTGTMIFQLIQEGKLSLTTPLSTYFPQLPNAEKITIANLLNHSSGLFNFTNDPGYVATLAQKVSQEELLAKFQHASVFEPGSKHEYSNTNYVLLGFIIEKLDKKTYDAALKARITTKLGLKDTYYGGKINPSNKEANSYKWIGSWTPDSETDMSIPCGAGALVSTPSDLVKFIDALFNGKLISQESLTQMKTLQGNYGMAMFVIPFYERQGYGHNGGIDGFQSVLAYYPTDKTAIAITANGVNTLMNNVTIGVLSIAFNKPYTIPSYANTFSVKPEDLDQYLGIYSTDKLPFKIAITKKDGILYGQATGQSAFPLEPVKANVFALESAGITGTFDVEKKQMTFQQGGATFVLTKDQ